MVGKICFLGYLIFFRFLKAFIICLFCYLIYLINTEFSVHQALRTLFTLICHLEINTIICFTDDEKGHTGPLVWFDLSRTLLPLKSVFDNCFNKERQIQPRHASLLYICYFKMFLILKEKKVIQFQAKCGGACLLSQLYRSLRWSIKSLAPPWAHSKTVSQVNKEIHSLLNKNNSMGIFFLTLSLVM